MNTTTSLRSFWLQAGGAAFAVVVALWSLQGTTGKDMAGIFACFAADSHTRTLARQVASLMGEGGHSLKAKPAVAETSVRESVPVPATETAMKLAAAFPARAGAPAPSVDSRDFPAGKETVWLDWSDRPPLPPPKSRG